MSAPHEESAPDPRRGAAPVDRPTVDGRPDLDALPGVAEAVERARSAIAAVRRLPANRRGWATTAAAAGIRAARASAMLDGGSAAVGDGLPRDMPTGDAAVDPVVAAGAARADGVVTDPVLAGALRVSAAVGELAAVWRRAPLQALARLHTLAAADLVPGGELGRPRPDGRAGPRLAALAQVVARSPWSGPVMVAVVHGELLTLRPFGSADGVVARAAARLTMVTTGLDPQALTVPEVGHLRAGAAYGRAVAGYAAAHRDGLAGWILHVCDALLAGAREGRSVAEAAGRPRA